MSTLPLTVLTAVDGQWEAPLVRGLDRHRDRLQVVRRCADVTDVLATAGSGLARAAVLSADLRGLDGDTLARLASCGCAVVALSAPGDEWSERRLRQLGLTTVLGADASPGDVATALHVAAGRLTGAAAGDDRRAPVAGPGCGHDGTGPSGSGPAGTVVAVWGPAGAPGRTTSAVNLAAELAAGGRPTLLVDADTHAASVGQVLGLLDEAPGVAAAARAADRGTLDLPALSRLAPQVVGTGLRVLTGLSSAHRWPELRPSSLSRVLALARSLVSWCVADVGSGLEQDEELSYDTAAPRRNGATRTVLEEADLVVAVGSADPIGLQRLVRGLQELSETGRQADTVVVTRLRSSAVGAAPLSDGPERRVRQALQRYAGVHDLLLVPYDVTAFDSALLSGRTLHEAAPGSPAQRAYQALARRLTGDRGPSAGQAVPTRPGRRTVRS